MGQGELWCTRCGEAVPPRGDGEGDAHEQHRLVCYRCGCTKLVPAVQVLRPEEYVVR